MLIKILLFVVAAYISFEIFEHLILPLVGKIFWKGKRHLTGPEGMIGKTGRVLEWHSDEGKVSIQSEIWNAVSDAPLSSGDLVIVEGIAGLTLKVKGGNPKARNASPNPSL
jgi:membrane-bound ClpP family serine protease